jgi:hypothetical protein
MKLPSRKNNTNRKGRGPLPLLPIPPESWWSVPQTIGHLHCSYYCFRFHLACGRCYYCFRTAVDRSETSLLLPPHQCQHRLRRLLHRFRYYRSGCSPRDHESPPDRSLIDLFVSGIYSVPGRLRRRPCWRSRLVRSYDD